MIAVILSAIAIALPAKDVSDRWTPPLVCQAAVSSYLFLERVPAFIGANGSEYHVKGPDGTVYSCELNADYVDLSWRDDKTVMQNNGPIMVKNTGNLLFVMTNISLNSFLLKDDGELTEAN